MNAQLLPQRQAFRIFYPGEGAQELFNEFLRHAQDKAGDLKLEGHEYDEFVHAHLQTTLDFFYKKKQAARAADPELLGDDRAKTRRRALSC